MVRIVCQNFQRPRSRHTSGESVSSMGDVDVVQRTSQHLGGPVGDGRDMMESDCGMSSDSFWESDGGYSVDVGDGKEQSVDKETILRRRKQRRRERNKVSAQAYRARRKEQGLSQKKTLTTLETQQKELLQKLHELEQEKSQVETFLRTCFRNKSVPWRVLTNNNTTPLVAIHTDRSRSPPPCSSPPQTVPEAMNTS